MSNHLWLALALTLASPPPSFAAANDRALDFGLDAAGVARTCSQAKARAEERLGRLALAQGPSFRESFVELQNVLADLNDETSAALFLAHVAVDKTVRDVSLACNTDLSQYAIDVYSREGLYRALRAAVERGELLEGEDRRLLEKTLLDFKRSGLDLPPERRERLKAARQEIAALSNDFSREVAEIKETVAFAPARMAGVPEDMLKRLPRDGEKYLVSLDYPDYFPFMENAKDPEARRELEARFSSRGGEKNKERLRKILALRQEAAGILGYKNHAEFVLADRMAQNPAAVFRFLEDLLGPLRAKCRLELKTLASLKKGDLGSASDGVIHAWDWRYYDRLLMRTRYSVDQEKVKEYFPMEHVVGEMLSVYQEVLGLRFARAQSSGTWHPEVEAFEVFDAATGVKLARFYLDLFPREGKYKHMGAFDLVQGRLLPDGSYQKPVSAIVGNFPKPTPDRPSLLKHDEVETLFHEFGHIMHQTLTRARYPRFSGTSVARDFVEAPSQCFENWVWDDAMLRRLSRRYADGSPMPEALRKKLIAARLVDAGIRYARQNFLAAYDMTLHTRPAEDTTALYARLMGEISLVPMSPGTTPESGFTHLMGYDAGYYGYLWSEVFAQDLFDRFKRNGLLDGKTGRDFRSCILEPGASRDENESLRAFLGRDPSPKAFLKSLGILGPRS